MLRLLRAQLLVVQILSSYLLQWLLVRVTARRFFESRWGPVHTVNAERLMRSCLSLRGVFIKLGQVIAVMGGSLPEPYRVRLASLQDRVPPQPFEAAVQRLTDTFGPDAMSAFRTFSQAPIAAASLAQVHRAELPDGQVVAVKILYPGIESVIEQDLRIIWRLIPLVRLLIPVHGVRSVHRQLSAMLRRETDYHQERKNLEALSKVFAHRNDVVIPKLIPTLCGATVLTMTFETGLGIGDRGALEQAAIDPHAVATLVTDCYITMFFEHRTFHADPHPGNLLVRPGPQLVILDFGAVESASVNMVEGLELAVAGALTRNIEQVLDAAEKMGFAAPDGNRELLRQAGRKVLTAIGELNIGDYDTFSPHIVRKEIALPLREWRSLLHHMQYPEGYFYVERTLAMLFGLVAHLNPKKGLPGVAAPLVSKMLLRSLVRRRPAPAQVPAAPSNPGP